MKAYFYDNNNRYIGNRELHENEELPSNATDIPVIIVDCQEAYFSDGVWKVNQIIEEVVSEVQE